MAASIKDDLNETARSVAAMLEEHKGGDVAVIDLRAFSSWTDFFVIATVRSNAHRSGLERQVKIWAAEHDMDARRGGSKDRREDNWSLIDLGTIVVHLMTDDARRFYELESLWGESAARINETSES